MKNNNNIEYTDNYYIILDVLFKAPEYSASVRIRWRAVLMKVLKWAEITLILEFYT